MNRTAVAVSLAALASPALAQTLAISFEPTGEPNTYEMVGEFFGPFQVNLSQYFIDDVRSVWADTHVRLTGDGPITVLDWNPTYDTQLGGPVITANGAAQIEFQGNTNNFFSTLDESNPLRVMRFRYEGSPSAFSAEMAGQNSLLLDGAPHLLIFLYMNVSGELGLATHSFGPLPGVECVADINGDGALSPGDFNAWILAFNNQSAGCDQNGDGMCTPSDFNAWILNYNAGC
ncbi:MAG: GC-type dockerin domain-anchored protein [Planctomycetota bacterium]